MSTDEERRRPLIKHPFGSWPPWSGLMVLTGTINSGKSRMAMMYAVEGAIQRHVAFLTTDIPADHLRRRAQETAYQKGIFIENRLVVHNAGGTVEKVLNQALMFAKHADLLIIDQLALKRESISRTMVSLREIERIHNTSILITVAGRRNPADQIPDPVNPTFSEKADIVMGLRRSKMTSTQLSGLSDDAIVDVMERAMDGDGFVELLCMKCREHEKGKGVLVDLKTMTSLGETQ
jgi:hypothetical protein